ncbi:hypothetical protein Mgra_00001757 [Meloidogyne graminicola]|uniref:Uncharacterized protein n=1 Tax=Meloidogyne graminicola TaxID=189291 RepID=A0A8S9ZZV3_9BILA|nr:hypothetical protein Mgra_00001757 [Meloidogyne graminicola]
MKSGAAKSKSSEGKSKGCEQLQKSTKEESDPLFSSMSHSIASEKETTTSVHNVVTPPMQFRPLPVANLSMTETDNTTSGTSVDDNKNEQRKRQGTASVWKVPKGVDRSVDPRNKKKD